VVGFNGDSDSRQFDRHAAGHQDAAPDVIDTSLEVQVAARPTRAEDRGNRPLLH
jgi:hypothetical protein